MKVLCKVNNYQYGMSGFKTIREQFSYKEELVDGKHHYVYLSFSAEQLNFGWLKRLLNNRVWIVEG